MSVVTVYDPDGVATAGNSQIGIAPIILDINNPLVSELSAGTVFECATEAFSSTTNVSNVTRKKLCDLVATERPGDRNYQVEQLSIVLDDPQGEDQPLLDMFGLDDTIYLWHRPGMAHDAAIEDGQKVQVVQAIVASVDLAPISTEAGEEYEFLVGLSVQGRTQVFGTVTADA